MPHTAAGALITMQIFYYPVFLDISDHIFGLFARVVYGLFTPGANWIYRLET